MLIQRKNAPAPLLDKVVVSLDVAGIVAGCKFRGEARIPLLTFHHLTVSHPLFGFISCAFYSLVRRANEEPADRGGTPRRSAGRWLDSQYYIINTHTHMLAILRSYCLRTNLHTSCIVKSYTKFWNLFSVCSGSGRFCSSTSSTRSSEPAGAEAAERDPAWMPRTFLSRRLLGAPCDVWVPPL